MLNGSKRTVESKYVIFDWYSLGKAPALAGNCRGAYLLAILAGISGTTGINGTTGVTGITGVTGTLETTVVLVCTVNEGVEGVLRDVDDELREIGVERNKTLTGV